VLLFYHEFTDGKTLGLDIGNLAKSLVVPPLGGGNVGKTA
jgi:hypothetical protein